MDDKKLKWWLSLLKRTIFVIVLLVLLWLGLYYTAVFNTYSPEANMNGESRSDGSWGISKDSPLRSNR